MMKMALRKDYERFVEKSTVPMFIYIYETGKINAMSESARNLTSNSITTVKQYLNADIYLNQNTIIYNLSVCGGDDNKRYDCEFNVIYADNKHYVICCMYDITKCVKALNTPKFMPIIYWNYVNDKVTLYNETAGNITFNHWVKENIEKLNLIKKPEVSDLYSRDAINRVNEHHLQIINNRKGKFDIVKMIEFSKNKIFGKYQKIPIVDEEGKVIVIITMLNQFLKEDDYQTAINNLIEEKNVAEGITDFSKKIYIVYDADDFSVRYITPNISKFGYNLRDFYSGVSNVLDIVHTEYIESLMQQVAIAKNLVEKERIIPYEFMFDDKINGPMLVKSDVIFKHKKDGKVYVSWLIKFEDEDAQELPRVGMDEVSKKLIKSYDVLNKVINIVDSMIFVLDENFNIVRINDKVKSYYQKKVFTHILGENIYDFFNKNKIYHYVPDKFNHKMYKKKMEGFCYDSINEIFYRYSVKRVDLIMVVTLLDISDFLGKNDEFVYKADFDLLTNTKNRIAYDIDIITAIRNVQNIKRKGAVVVFDINEFKIINKKYGYELGDKILFLLAEEIKKSSELAEKCYRIGGDSFSVILDNEDYVKKVVKELKDIAKRIKIIIKHGVSFSFGVCTFSEQYISGNRILENSILALNKAKKNGKNSVVFYSKSMENMDNDTLDRIAYMEDFVGNKNGKLKVLYHPIFGDDLEGTVYVKPVVSFIDNEGKQINPLEVVSINEYSKTVRALDSYLYKNSFLISSKLNKISSKKCVVTIKLSVIKMIEEGFIEELKEMIRCMNVDVDNISFELNEMIFGEHEYYIRKVLTIMGEMGLKIGINDLSKEYIYLNNLFEFPFHYIVIDEECLKMIIESKGDYKNIISFIEKAKKLNIIVIAKNYGIENISEKLNVMGLGYIEVYKVLETIEESTLLNYLSVK